MRNLDVLFFFVAFVFALAFRRDVGKQRCDLQENPMLAKHLLLKGPLKNALGGCPDLNMRLRRTYLQY